MLLCRQEGCRREATAYIHWVVEPFDGDTDYIDGYTCDDHTEITLPDGWKAIETTTTQLPKPKFSRYHFESDSFNGNSAYIEVQQLREKGMYDMETWRAILKWNEDVIFDLTLRIHPLASVNTEDLVIGHALAKFTMTEYEAMPSFFRDYTPDQLEWRDMYADELWSVVRDIVSIPLTDYPFKSFKVA